LNYKKGIETFIFQKFLSSWQHVSRRHMSVFNFITLATQRLLQ